MPNHSASYHSKRAWRGQRRQLDSKTCTKYLHLAAGRLPALGHQNSSYSQARCPPGCPTHSVKPLKRYTIVWVASWTIKSQVTSDTWQIFNIQDGQWLLLWINFWLYISHISTECDVQIHISILRKLWPYSVIKIWLLLLLLLLWWKIKRLHIQYGTHTILNTVY